MSCHGSTAIRIRAPHQHVPPRVCLVTYENVDTLVREYHSRIGEDREIPSMKIISLRSAYDHRKTLVAVRDEEFIVCEEEIRSRDYFLENRR